MSPGSSQEREEDCFSRQTMVFHQEYIYAELS